MIKKNSNNINLFNKNALQLSEAQKVNFNCPLNFIKEILLRVIIIHESINFPNIKLY